MKHGLQKRDGIAAAVGLASAAVACVAALLLLRYSGSLFAENSVPSAIFAQLTEASVRPPWLLALLLGGLCGFACGRVPKRWITVLLAVLGILLLVCLALLLTAVNGILFGDILFSLLGVLAKGGL